MRVDPTGQTDHFAAYASSIPARQRAARSVPAIRVAGILVPAIWSGTGLVLSAIFVLSLGDAAVADDTFGFLAGLLG